MRNTAAHGGKSEGLQITYTMNGTGHDGTHHRADQTVTVDDVGGQLPDGCAAKHSPKNQGVGHSCVVAVK